MIERFHSHTYALYALYALQHRLDVVLQSGFGVRVTEMRLDILDCCQLGHVRRASAPKHLVCDSGDASLLAPSPEDAEEKIVGINRDAPGGLKNETVVSSIFADGSPPFQLRIYGDRRPDTCVAPFRLVSTSIPSVMLLSIRGLFCKSKDKKHSNNQAAAIAEVEKNNRNLRGRKVDDCNLFA